MDRAKAVEGAMASMRMEGFVYTDEEIILFEKLANGEISHAELRKIFDEQLKNMRKDNPQFFVK